MNSWFCTREGQWLCPKCVPEERSFALPQGTVPTQLRLHRQVHEILRAEWHPAQFSVLRDEYDEYAQVITRMLLKYKSLAQIEKYLEEAESEIMLGKVDAERLSHVSQALVRLGRLATSDD